MYYAGGFGETRREIRFPASVSSAVFSLCGENGVFRSFAGTNSMGIPLVHLRRGDDAASSLGRL